MSDKVTRVVTKWSQTGLGNVTRKTLTYKNALGHTRRETYKLSGTMKGGVQMWDRTAVTTTKNTKAMSGFSSSLRRVGLGMIGMNFALQMGSQGFQRLIQFVGDSVKGFREFELRIAEVSTIMDTDVDKSIHRLESGVVDLSLAFGQATGDLAKGLYDIMSAAFDSQDAINLLNTATVASIAGLSDVRTSVDIFTTVLNTYGMTVAEATTVSDQLFQSVVRGKFQFADLEAAMGYVVPIAAQAGIAFDELMAALSTATRHGLHLDMTARGLALAIQGIVNPSAQAKAAAELYGLEMDGLSLRIHGLHGWFMQLSEKVDEFGKGIIGELIPNMRSLRVAMVLAGEEGLQGFTEDLNLLTLASGRTNQALEKIMNTQQFLANQITQQWAKTQREVGEQWSAGVLAAQSFGMGMFQTLGMFGTALTTDVREWGTVWETYKHGIDTLQGKTEQGTAVIIENLSEYGKAIQYLKSMDIAEALSADIDIAMLEGATEDELNALNRELEIHIITMRLTQDAYNGVIGPIDSATRAMEDWELTVEEVEHDISRLNDLLVNQVSYGWGQYANTIKGTRYYELELLKAQQLHTDMLHNITIGLKSADYEWKTMNNLTVEQTVELKGAVDGMREYKKILDENKKSADLLNIAMRRNNLEIMKIQLRGMLRRRGQTRGEERAIKKLQIANMELRISIQEDQAEITEVQLEGFHNYEEIIDKYKMEANELMYQMKYTYNQEIKDLEDTIATEENLLTQRNLDWATAFDKLIEVTDDKIGLLTAAIANPDLKAALLALGIDLEAMLGATTGKKESIFKSKTAQFVESAASPGVAPEKSIISGLANIDMAARVKRHNPGVYDLLKMKGLPGFKRGTYYAPSDEPVMIHRGEQVIPAGDTTKAGGNGDTIIENVTINVEQIADLGSAEQLCALLSSAQSSRHLNARGRTKYRPR